MNTDTQAPETFPGSPRRVIAVYHHPDGPTVQAIRHDHHGGAGCLMGNCPDVHPHKHVFPISVEAP